jgi:hypothetical protein
MRNQVDTVSSALSTRLLLPAPGVESASEDPFDFGGIPRRLERLRGHPFLDHA